MAHRVAPLAEADLDDIWFYVAKESGSVEMANRLIDTVTDRFLVLAGFPTSDVPAMKCRVEVCIPFRVSPVCLCLPYSEGGHRSSKLWPCSSIGWKWRRGSLRERERRSLRTDAGLKSCRHKGLTRAVASKRSLPVGEPPGSNRHCWCKRSWKEYAYRRKSRHFRHDPSPGPRHLRKHAPFERNGNINDCGGQRGSSFSEGTPQRRESFAVETTLSGKNYLQMMQYARGIDRGFEVVLIYIGTESVEINLARIAKRVLAGGHNVPEMDVRRRYLRSLQNLPAATGLADRVIVFDNSDDLGYRLVGLLGRGLHQWFDPLPAWAAELQKRFPPTTNE